MNPDSAVLLVIAELRARLAAAEEENAALRAELQRRHGTNGQPV